MKLTILIILAACALELLFLGCVSHYLKEFAPAPKPVAITGAVIAICAIWLALL